MPKFSNVQPSINPKMLSVQRIDRIVMKDGAIVGRETLVVKNIETDPRDLTIRRY